MTEVANGVQSYSAYIRTYHKLLPDGLTRESWQSVLDQITAEGWKQVSILGSWTYYLEELKRQEEARPTGLVCLFCLLAALWQSGFAPR